MRRLLGIVLLAAVLVPSASTATPARPQTRIVFSGQAMIDQGVYDLQQLYSVLASGDGAAQLTFENAASTDPVPSPDGRLILFRRGDELWLMKPDGSTQRRLVRGEWAAWSPDSRRIAYVDGDDVRTIRPDGKGEAILVRKARLAAWSPDGKSLAFVRGLLSGAVRVILRRSGRDQTLDEVAGVDALSWSPDGRWLALACSAHCGEDLLKLVRPSGGGSGWIRDASRPAWSPRGDHLAFLTHGGLALLSVRTNRVRDLVSDPSIGSFAWSPDGTEIAVTRDARGRADPSGSLWAVAPTAQSRRIPPLPYVEVNGSLAWARVAPGLAFRSPLPRSEVAEDEIRSRVPVQMFDADGDAVAFPICNEIDVWSRTQTAVQRIPQSSYYCTPYFAPRPYTFALAGSRVALGTVGGGTSKQAILQVFSRVDRSVALFGRSDAGDGTRIGEPVGNGDLLAFSSWAICRTLSRPCIGNLANPPTLATWIWRAHDASWPGACPKVYEIGTPSITTIPGPCQELTSESGPLVPYDADTGRIVAAGDNAVVVLDESGARLTTVPVKALAAQLSASDLVLLVPGALRAYDAETGALRASWPLPDVSSGPSCWYCGTSRRLRLEDVAHGLAAYILDGKLHLRRLSDGADAGLSDATAARFGDSGLYYSYEGAYPWKGRIRFVPFDQLPLR